VNWDETCGVCGNDNPALWWRSRSGYQVCAICAVTPFDALIILARRGRPGLVKIVQAWGVSEAPMAGR
jgi:hypothetical protein